MESTMQPTPATWHKRPAAQALIGKIAAAGIAPQTRPVRNMLSADYAPHYFDVAFYDCPEFEQLAAMQQDALSAALKAEHAAPKVEGHTKDNPAYADFYALVAQYLASLIGDEIAARNVQVAA